MRSTKTPTVLIMGHHSDEHAQLVGRILKSRGVEVFGIDAADFPANLEIASNPDGSGTSIRPSGAARFLDSSQINAIYWRNYNRIRTLPLSDPEQAYIAQNDSRSHFESFLGDETFRWVNGLAGFELHQRKPLALRRVAQLGVKVPRTIITNSSTELRKFCDEASGGLIFKPVQGGAHAQRLEASHLSDEHTHLLRLSPVTVQQEIRGTNVRVFVAGHQILACEVRTEHLDFRDDRRPEIIAHSLTDQMAAQSFKIANALNLNWAGIDYRLDVDGEYYFLEANPSPMFAGFESASNVPISEMLIGHLIG